VDVDSINFAQLPLPERVVFFLGINPGREAIKGSNLFQQAFDRLRQKTGHGVDLLQVTALPYSEYQTQMSRAHTVLDQTFSQSPAMNALLALAMGKIVVSNAQKEYYSMLGEKNNFPVIDIFPNVEDIETKLEYVIASIDSFPQWSNQGRLFVEQHHNAKEIARQYLDFWNKC
jgi:hypothetical protein